MPNRRDRPPDEIFQTTIRVERGMYERFQRVAEANHRTTSQEIRLLMERHVSEAEEPAAA